jgi:hypothetical protein
MRSDYTDELFFAVYCIENISDYLGMTGSEAYKLLTQNNAILDEYIIPSYDVLHTQSKEYIINDIVEYMRDEGLVQ